MKNIQTLVKDIYDVIDGKGGWGAAVHEFFTESMSSAVWRRLGEDRESRKPTLRLSAMGAPCTRKLWYDINEPDEREDLRPSTLFKFLYGDILEELVLSLAIAAGHRVEGCQDELNVAGIKGHRDAVIDGVTVDVKSASPYSFKKFESGNLRDEDPFGYISQLSSYVYAGRNQTDVESHPSLGAFLVVDKVSGELCLDMYDLGHEINTKEDDIQRIKEACNDTENVPERAFKDEEDGYWKGGKTNGVFVPNGNRYLGVQCSYCGYKDKCWTGLRTFVGSGKPKFLTHVEKVPAKLKEVT